MSEATIKNKLCLDNILRLKYLIVIATGFSIVAFILDLLKVEFWIGSHPKAFFIMDSILLIISLVYVFLFFIVKHHSFRVNNFLFHCFVFFILVWSALITGIGISSTGFSTYLVVLISIVVTFYIEFYISLIFYLFSYGLIIATLSISKQLNDDLFTMLFTFFPVLIVSILISRRNQILKYNNLRQEEKLHQLSLDLTNTNESLEKQVARRTEKLRHTNTELRKAKEKAEESDRLKTQFLNNMSHEVRTPMNGIIGFSEMLERKGIDDDKKNVYIKIIRKSCEQLLHIIEDILEISTLEVRQKKINDEKICMNSFLNDLSINFENQAKEKQLSIKKNLPLDDEGSFLICDKDKLKKILEILLDNALKFTLQGEVEIGYAINGQQISFYVKDTGVGIAAENKEIIFERFSQEDKSISRKFGGIGLGLAIAKANAEILGGNITLDSEKDKGSTFYLTLPYIFMKDQKQDKKNKILIAEDEDINALYIKILIEEIGPEIKIVHARNGKDTVALCQEHPDIGLVLMDMKMPVMNGYEATKKIKALFPELPVIAQTAYVSDSEKQKAYDAGCSDIISKPIDNERFVRIVSKYMISNK